MKVVAFDYSARFGHFLRAEANANALSYPVPPRTVLLGLFGAVLGLTKDEPQKVLAEAQVAVSGPVPQQHWHQANLRKDPPAPLPFVVKAQDKGSSSEQRNTILPQQWLWKPRYRVWATLPGKYHADLAARLRERRWYFSPCMGLSEMMADLTDVQEVEVKPLPQGLHRIRSVLRHDAGRVETSTACAEGLALQTLRMPRTVTPDRVFSHATYLLERDARPIPVETAEAWAVEEDVVMFL
jgi:CRISPR-associated protein Cas5h